MSNHYSAANLRFPGDDARLDFTDLGPDGRHGDDPPGRGKRAGFRDTPLTPSGWRPG